MTLLNTFKYESAFKVVQNWLGTDEPLDYFDFPASATAFTLSLKNSTPFTTDCCLFRKRAKQYKLISFRGNPMNDILRRNAKCLPFSFRPYPEGLDCKSAPKQYYTELPYNFEAGIAHHRSRNRGRLRRDYRQGSERYVAGFDDVTREEMRILWDTWMREAEGRHFMLLKGHHQAYIEMFFNGVGGVRFITFREQGRLCGVIGFEIVGRKAQMTIGKHELGDNCLSTFYYVRALEMISELGATFVLCGDSNDEFKRRIGLSAKSSWRFK